MDSFSTAQRETLPGNANRERRDDGERGFFTTLLTQLLPQECALCGAVAGRWPVCAVCATRLPRLPEKHCPRCADTSSSGDLCGRCLGAPPHYDRVLAPFAYLPPVDALIGQLKYGHRIHLARWFAHELTRIASPVLLLEVDFLLPMPLHPQRLAERGFNQAMEIARHLGPGPARRRTPSLLPPLLSRRRMTTPQVELSYAERQRNLDQAFDCRADLGAKTVLVIDDVMTSGSTANELARTLKAHGAARVLVAVLARTLHQ